jgi:hypothetical protein
MQAAERRWIDEAGSIETMAITKPAKDPDRN